MANPHGLPTGDYNVPLIGGAAAHEKTDGYFTGLFKRNHPEFQRKIRALVTDAMRQLSSLEYRGRPRHKLTVTAANWVTDLAELRKNIILCWQCAHKFDYEAYGYHKDRRWQIECGGVLGVCDGCRTDGQLKKQLFVHQSLVGFESGQSHCPDPGYRPGGAHR